MGLFGLKKRKQKQKQFSHMPPVALPENNRYNEQADGDAVLASEPEVAVAEAEDDSKIVETKPSTTTMESKPSSSPVVERKSSSTVEASPSSASNTEPLEVNQTRSAGSRISKVASRLSNRVSSRGSNKSISMKHTSSEKKTIAETFSAPDDSASLSVPSIAVSESRDETLGMSNRKSSLGSKASNSFRESPSAKSSHSVSVTREKSSVSQEPSESSGENKDAASVTQSIKTAESNNSDQTSASKKSKATFMEMLLGKSEPKPEEITPKEEPEQIFEKDEKKESNTDKEVNYDISPTLLYKFIEYRDWDEALERCTAAPEEAKTWVFRYDQHDKDEIYYGEKQERSIRWKMLPIHVAIIFSAPLKVVAAILDANPAGIKSADDRKMLPLHLCARNLTDPKVAKYLVEREPETLNFTDYKGRIPLKILTEYRDKIAEKNDKKSMLELKQREEIIKLMKIKMGITDADDDDKSLMETDDDDEDGTVTTDKEDRMTSDSLLEKRSSVSDCAPTERKNSTPEKLTPRKLSLSRKKSLKKSSTPKGIGKETTSEDERYNIVPQEDRQRNYLKRDQKKSTREVDYDTTPTVLIKLIERKMWEQAITRCVENPDEASTWMSRLQEVNDKLEGKKEIRWKILPIHSAIVLHAPVEVIEALVNAYPQGLRKGDDRKMLPLHMAFRLGASPETTAVLVDAYPDAIKKKDSKGHTPLHILKAYRRKYQKERNRGNKSNSDMDKNRKHLIRFYLGSRRYGSDDDATLAPYDSGSDSDDDSDYSDESAWDDDYYDDDEEEEDYDRLFNKSMFSDFGRLTVEGISAVPEMLRDTLSCNTRY